MCGGIRRCIMTDYDSMPWLKSYDANVEHQIAINEDTYADLIEVSMSRYPEKPAFHFLGHTCTFGELDKLSQRFAGYLIDKGCVPGDVVGINLPNTPQYLIALCGIMRAGCVASGVSPLLTPKEMAYQINDSGVKVLVTLDAILEHRVQKIGRDVPSLKSCVATNIADFLPFYKRYLGKLLKKIPSGKIEPVPGKDVISFKDLLKKYPAVKPRVKIKADDTCLIQYTGGTTGMPKGAVLTHRNLVSNIKQAAQWLNFEMGSGVACSGFPFFHQAGLFSGMITMAWAYTQCLIPDPRNTDNVCKEIDEHKPRVMLHVPSLYQMLMDNPKFSKIDFSGCEVCISGAAPFSKEAMTALENIVGKGKIVEIFGMTEASPLISMNPLKGEKRLGSVGLPLQNTRVKIVDVETGTIEMPLREAGEIIVQGPQVMKGYHDKPEDTNVTLREFKNEKWLYTGDIGWMDEEGYLYLVDRAKDMLIVSGFKVFSREVEETLYQNGSVHLCAIIGIPNPKRSDSQIVKAFIQLTEEAKNKDHETIKKELLNHCQENLAAYKVPKIIEIIEAIPLTAVGKVDKKALR
jgi:acyl-CoA synthetase (AMP-forming)/AMP-acid ligase II